MARRRWYGSDTGLKTRMTLTIFGLGLIYVIFIGALIAAGASAVLILVIAGGIALAQVFFGDKIAFRADHVAAQAAASHFVDALGDARLPIAAAPRPGEAVERGLGAIVDPLG